MFRKFLYTLFLTAGAFFLPVSGQNAPNGDTVMVLPFENSSGKAEFNWVGESFANALTGLLDVPGLQVVSNKERKLIQQRLNVPLTILPSLATSLKLAREADASLLIFGKYNIVPARDDIAAAVKVTAKIIRVDEGQYLSEEFPGGRRITRDIDLTDALENLQTVQGQVAYQILYQRDKALPFSQNKFIEQANKVPARAFEAYIKGLLSRDNIETREIYLKNALKIFADERNGEVYAEAALELGHLYLQQGKEGGAIEFFSKVPSTAAGYPEAAFFAGLIQWEKKNYEQALAILHPLADELKLTVVYNTLGAIAVEASRREKNEAKAAALLNDGIGFLKRAVESAPEEVNHQFNYGLALFLSGNFRDAIPRFLEVVKKRQFDGEAYFLLAKAFEKVRESEKAADSEDNAKRYLIRDNRYAKLQVEWENAKNIGIKMRVEKPERSDFLNIVPDQISRPAAAVRLSETDSLLAAAEKHYGDGNDDEAMAVLRKVLVGEPMSARAYLVIGKIHLRRGDLEQAISSLKTALFWDNRLIEAHLALGRIYLEKDNCLQAKNYSASASAIDSENQQAAALERQVERCSK